MRPLFAYLRAAVVPTAVFAAPEDWGASGATPAAGSAAVGSGPADSLQSRVERAAGELAEAVAARPPRVRADEFADVPDFTALLKG